MSKIMKERPVGTIFNWHGKRLEVVENTDIFNAHNDCVFCSRNCLSQYKCNRIPCIYYERSDNKTVHYKEVK